MADIKIKRCADKENLKKLMRYIKATFANKSETNEKFYTKEQIDTMLESGSGGTGGDYYTKSEIDTKLNLKVNTSDLSNYYTKEQINKLVIYDLVPDGAEAHNSIWGGRDITAAFDSGEFSRNVADGSFRDIFPGDYIIKDVTISGKTYTVSWVVADCDYWINKGDTAMTAMTAHHVVIVPQVPIFTANMNDTDTTEGGYMGSRMYRKTIPAFAAGIVKAFGSSHILTFRDNITNSVDTSYVSSGFPQFNGTPGWWGEWVSVQCNLMSEKMVYGAPICSAGAMNNTMATRQMSAFRLSEKLINSGENWWLRDVATSEKFAMMYNSGDASAYGASGENGVRPFALLR